MPAARICTAVLAEVTSSSLFPDHSKLCVFPRRHPQGHFANPLLCSDAPPCNSSAALTFPGLSLPSLLFLLSQNCLCCIYPKSTSHLSTTSPLQQITRDLHIHFFTRLGPLRTEYYPHTHHLFDYLHYQNVAWQVTTTQMDGSLHKSICRLSSVFSLLLGPCCYSTVPYDEGERRDILILSVDTETKSSHGP